MPMCARPSKLAQLDELDVVGRSEIPFPNTQFLSIPFRTELIHCPV
jgi:hypothetical protein